MLRVRRWKPFDHAFGSRCFTTIEMRFLDHFAAAACVWNFVAKGQLYLAEEEMRSQTQRRKTYTRTGKELEDGES